MNKELYRSDWLELSNDWGLHYKLDMNGHYGDRPVVSFYLTSVLSILALTPLLLWLGLGWWTALVVAPLALYGWGWVFITLPFKTSKPSDKNYGVYFLDRAFWFPWGSKIHKIEMPWAWVWKRRSVLSMESVWPVDDRRLKKRKLLWIHSSPGNRLSFWREEYKPLFWERLQIFSYTLQDGEEQITKAHIRVEEFEHRWKILSWCPWFARIERYIDIRFDDPVGEGVGTYKGGVYGTGMKMKEGEHPIDTFKRFEEKAEFRR